MLGQGCCDAEPSGLKGFRGPRVQPTSVSCNWDGFYTSVVGWARQLGFPLQVVAQGLPSSSSAPAISLM